MHCLVYQTMTTPNGLIFHIYGPETGRCHDITFLRHDGIEDVLTVASTIDGVHHYLYGDATYMLRP